MLICFEEYKDDKSTTPGANLSEILPVFYHVSDCLLIHFQLGFLLQICRFGFPDDKLRIHGLIFVNIIQY